MTKQTPTTRKQHIIPRFYLKRFADNNGNLQILDIQRGKIIKPRPYSGVCYGDFFYAIETGKEDEISQLIEKLLSKIENQFAREYNNIINTIWDYKPLSERQANTLAQFMACLLIRSSCMRDRTNKMMLSGIKEIFSMIASHPDFIDNTKEILKTYGTTLTDQQTKCAIDNFESSNEQELNNIYHLILISHLDEFHHWLTIKKWRFYLAKGSKKFITTDTPVVEVFEDNREKTLIEQIYNNHIVQRRHYFALTPEILVELIDPSIPGKRQKRKAIMNNNLINQANIFLLKWSNEYAYTADKKFLEDILPSYKKQRYK